MASIPSNSLITTDVDYDQPGYQAGHLRLPYSHDRSGYGFIPIPIAVLKQGEGPTVLLTGGNHGDEYEGPVALMKLMRRMPGLQVSGKLIVIRSEENTSELQSLMRISYADFCLKKKN